MQQKVRTVSGHKSLPTYIYLILLLQINTALYTALVERQRMTHILRQDDDAILFYWDTIHTNFQQKISTNTSLNLTL